jgi:hypothetical protein
MADRSSASSGGGNKLKLVLIPVLGFVLYYVVSSSPSSPPAPTLTVRQATAPAAASVGQPIAAVAPSIPYVAATQTPPQQPRSAQDRFPVSKAVTWPTSPLAEVLAVNPFKLPRELRQITAKPTPEPLPLGPDEDEIAVTRTLEMQNAVKGHRLTALVQTSRGAKAIVGENVVGVGDLVGDRLRVTAIHADGVELELIDAPPVQPEGKMGERKRSQ